MSAARAWPDFWLWDPNEAGIRNDNHSRPHRMKPDEGWCHPSCLYCATIEERGVVMDAMIAGLARWADAWREMPQYEHSCWFGEARRGLWCGAIIESCPERCTCGRRASITFFGHWLQRANFALDWACAKSFFGDERPLMERFANCLD